MTNHVDAFVYHVKESKQLDPETVDTLLEHLKEEDEQTVLRILGHIRKYGINGLDKAGSHPIVEFWGRLRVVFALLLAGTSPNLTFRNGVTLLMCYSYQFDVSRCLLKVGVDINQKCLNGFTVLDHGIMRGGTKEVICLFLQYGCHCDLKRVFHTGIHARVIPRYEYVRSLMLVKCLCHMKDFPKDLLRFLRMFLVHDLPFTE
jgi:hypothetical protein